MATHRWNNRYTTAVTNVFFVMKTLQKHAGLRLKPSLNTVHRVKQNTQDRVFSVFVLSLGLLWVSRAALGLTQRADRSIPVNLLVAGQTGLHGRWLLLAEMPLPRRATLVDQLLCGGSCCS